MSQKSTGPRTPEGKQRSSVNARKHGFSGRTLIVAEDQQESFDQFIADWERDLKPAGAIENELFGQVIHAAWTLRRLDLAEADLIDAGPPADPLTIDAAQNKLRLYSIYKSRAERSFHKSLDALRRIQEERLLRAHILPESNLPALPRTAHLRREIARDKRTAGQRIKSDIEAFLNAPLPGQPSRKLTPDS